jgi:hypothetical protein
MARPRGQTLQQRFGFLDDDLKTPSHDEVMTWVTEHIEQVIIELFWDSEWPAEERRQMELEAQGIVNQTAAALVLTEWTARAALAEKIGLSTIHAADALQRAAIERSIPNLISASEQQAAEYRRSFTGLTLPPRPLFAVDKVVWELPLQTDGKFLVGFVDLYVEVRQPHLALTGYTYADRCTGLEIYRRASDPRTLRAVVSDHWKVMPVYLEVKAAMPSAGELIRQIRMYQEYVQGEWVVVSPDDRHRSILDSQGIQFYQAPRR